MIEERYRIMGYGIGGWNSWTRMPSDPIDEAEARRRHDAGEPYGVVLTVGGGGLIELPIVGITLDSEGITVDFFRRDPVTADLTHYWVFDRASGRCRISQIDRRADHRNANPAHRRHDEYLRLEDGTAAWVHGTGSGEETVERRPLDPAPFDLAPPVFGEYDAYLDDRLAEELWPDLPELEWVGVVVGRQPAGLPGLPGIT